MTYYYKIKLFLSLLTQVQQNKSVFMKSTSIPISKEKCLTFYLLLREPYTDYLVSTGLEEEGLSGPVELPPGADDPDVYDEVQEDDINSLLPQEANIAELDNYLIDQSENECRQVL